MLGMIKLMISWMAPVLLTQIKNGTLLTPWEKPLEMLASRIILTLIKNLCLNCHMNCLNSKRLKTSKSLKLHIINFA